MLFSLCGISGLLLGEGNHESEALMVRRIVALSQAGEDTLVRQQILTFTSLYPQSSFQEKLYRLLGDLEFRQEHWEEALKAYLLSGSESETDQILIHRMTALEKLSRYKEVEALAEKHLAKHAADPLDSKGEICLFYLSRVQQEQGEQLADAIKAQPYFLRAREGYERLVKGSYRKQALCALANLYQKMNHGEKAAEIYLTLAKDDVPLEDEYIFQAAKIYLQVDKRKAIALFRQVEQGNSPRQGEAALLETASLFDLQAHQELIERSDLIGTLVGEAGQKPFRCYVGSSYLAIHQPALAIEQFEKIGFDAADSSPLRKNVLLSSIICMEKLSREAEMESQASRFFLIFPNDPQKGNILFLMAQHYRKNNNDSKASEYLSCLEKEAPDFHAMDLLSFEKASILFRQANYIESRKAFVEFLKAYPNSPLQQNALQQLSLSSLKILEGLPPQDPQYSSRIREAAADLQKLLETPDLQESVKSVSLLQLARLKYDLKEYAEACQTAKKYLQAYPKDSQSHQAHLILALSSYQRDDMAVFIAEAEEVIKTQPHIPCAGVLHKYLFNAYIQLAQKNPPKAAYRLFLIQASEHLYTAIHQYRTETDPKHSLWLAKYYCDRIQERQDKYSAEPLSDPQEIQWIERSLSLLKDTLPFDRKGHLFITNPSEQVESGIINLSLAYGYLNKKDEQQQVLETLVKTQKNLSFNWQHTDTALFYLSQCYEKQGKQQQALEGLSQLLQQHEIADPYLCALSKLQYARGLFFTVPLTERNPTHPKILQSLQIFREIEIQRSLATEPIHLEAAIDRAEIHASLAVIEKRESTLKIYLNAAKELFTQRDDILSKDYHKMRQENVEKEEIYQAYLMLVDAKIASADAFLQRKALKGDGRQQEDAARALFQNLQKGHYALTHYLRKDAEESLKALDKGNISLHFEGYQKESQACTK